jgi:hypothetical protein
MSGVRFACAMLATRLPAQHIRVSHEFQSLGRNTRLPSAVRSGCRRAGRRRCPGSFDCSGLTQYVYDQVGVNLPRQAIQQSKAGDAAGRRLQRGDLLFFSTDTRRSVVTHVGLYEGNGVMIDASKRHGRVRRDDLSDQYWAERFMFARRVDSSAAIPDQSTRRDRAPDLRRQAAIQVLRGVAEVLLERRRR